MHLLPHSLRQIGCMPSDSGPFGCMHRECHGWSACIFLTLKSLGITMEYTREQQSHSVPTTRSTVGAPYKKWAVGYGVPSLLRQTTYCDPGFCTDVDASRLSLAGRM